MQLTQFAKQSVTSSILNIIFTFTADTLYVLQKMSPGLMSLGWNYSIP